MRMITSGAHPACTSAKIASGETGVSRLTENSFPNRRVGDRRPIREASVATDVAVLSPVIDVFEPRPARPPLRVRIG